MEVRGKRSVLFSLMVAFVVSPWAALRLLRHYASQGGHDKHELRSTEHRAVLRGRRATTPDQSLFKVQRTPHPVRQKEFS